MEAFKNAVERVQEVAERFDVVDRIAEVGPLHRAAAVDDAATLRWLLQRGEDPDDDDGTAYAFTTAHWAAMRSGERIIKLLFDHGANLSALDQNKMTPLHIAALSGNVPVVSWLIENIGNLEAREDYYQTPLHQAALNGKLEVAEMLVNAGANIEAADMFGLTPICLAVVRGFPNVVGLFLKRGADHTIRDRNQKTLLHAAAAGDQTVVIGWLLGKGLDVDAKDLWNCTPLHDAAQNGCCDAINLLLDRGANGRAKDLKGCTPACKARNAGEMKALNLLLKRINSEDSKDTGEPKEGSSSTSQMKRAKGNVTSAKIDIPNVIKKKKLIKIIQRGKKSAPAAKTPADPKYLPVVRSGEVKISSAGFGDIVQQFTFTRSGGLKGVCLQAGGACRHVDNLNKFVPKEDSSSEDEGEKNLVNMVNVVNTDSGNERVNHSWEAEMDSALAKLTHQEILRIIC